MVGRKILAMAVLSGAFWAASAGAKTVLQPSGRFQLKLPDDFRVSKAGQWLRADSPRGNVKVFARSWTHRAPTYDFNGHFTRWEQTVRKRRVFETLRRVGDAHTTRENGHVAVWRVYDAEAKRVRSIQPYRVFVLAAHNPAARRVYTLSIASHPEFYRQNQARLVAIASSFRPYAVTASTPRAVKRVSLAGKLKRSPGREKAERRVHSAREALARARARREAAQRALEEARRRKEELRRQIEETRRRKEDLRRQIEEARHQRERQKAAARLAQLKKRQEAARKALERVRAKKRAARRALEQARAKHAAAKKALERERRRKLAAIEALRKKKAHLSAKKKSSKKH